MATFVERCMAYPYDSYEGEEQISGDQVWRMLLLYMRGTHTASWVKTTLGLTTGQGNELDEVLATLPAEANVITLLGINVGLGNATERAQWPDKVAAMLCLGAQRHTDYNTPTKVRAALGL